MADDILPAASLILMRDRRSAPPELLIVRRGDGLVFAAGAYVFPGGRVDPEDHALASRLYPHLEPGDGAARVAAVRETQEETTIAGFDAAALTPFARWLPQAEIVPRRFDTRFYLAQAGEGMAEPVADGVESSHAFWATADAVLARCAAGEGRAVFPTRRLLERLARFASFAEARAEAERLPQRIISPWIEQRADGPWLRIPDDAGYPVTGEPIETAARY